MEPVNLKAFRQKGDQDENEKIAQIFEDAARRARRGEFRMAAWFASGREEYAALFGWQKFGSIIPLIGAGYTLLQEMATSPSLKLEPLPDDEPELPLDER